MLSAEHLPGTHFPRCFFSLCKFASGRSKPLSVGSSGGLCFSTPILPDLVGDVMEAALESKLSCGSLEKAGGCGSTPVRMVAVVEILRPHVSGCVPKREGVGF